MSLITSIKDLDTQLFLFLNGKHNLFFDTVMFWASHKFVWIPLYTFLFYLVYKHFGKKVWLFAIAVAVTIVLSDQISVHAFKNVFLRYRPCHNTLIRDQVHVNGGCGGTYGFVSSHAANTFALAMLLGLLFRNRIKNFGLLIFSWAIFVSYSRIYNGAHYPADIAIGGILGMGIAVAVFKLFEFVDKKIKLTAEKTEKKS
ncbi:MAG: phosphatase PAP2 family protein [Bacteroidota bacterium]